jgi:hypothetical protein
MITVTVVIIWVPSGKAVDLKTLCSIPSVQHYLICPANSAERLAQTFLGW